MKSEKRKNKEEIISEELEKETQKEIEEIVVEEIIEEEGEKETEEKETEEKENELLKLKAENEELKADYLRKNAEFQNFTRRKEKEMEELRKYASEKIIIKLLDSIDNLERGIIASIETKDFDSLVKGVEMTLSQMKAVLKSEGVEEIDSEGAMYDPVLHHAVAVEESENHENDQIISIFQKAYKMKDKVIRPAMVKVCKK